MVTKESKEHYLVVVSKVNTMHYISVKLILNRDITIIN